MRTIALVLVMSAATALAQVPGSDWLLWTPKYIESVGRAAYVRGRVGGFFDTRLLKTERAYNYKLAGTLFTPSVIRAAARAAQLAERLSDAEARALVREAEDIQGIAVMVDIDPREGSGVIPNDWLAFLRPVFNDQRQGEPVRGVNSPHLRNVRAFAGISRRNYDYDRFWMVFPRAYDDGTPVVTADTTAIELVVRVSGQEGRVQWPHRDAIRFDTSR